MAVIALSAWVLVSTMFGYSVVINDIASKEACEDLWKQFDDAQNRKGSWHSCLSYKKADPR